MRKINIRELRKNLAQELNNLPFIITRRGNKIAMCTLPKKLGEKTESSVHKENNVFFNPVPKPK